MGIEPTEPPSPTAPLDLKSRGGTSPLALPRCGKYRCFDAFASPCSVVFFAPTAAMIAFAVSMTAFAIVVLILIVVLVVSVIIVAAVVSVAFGVDCDYKVPAVSGSLGVLYPHGYFVASGFFWLSPKR